MITHSAGDALDGMPRRSNHSSSGTSAIATTSAAVTGMKNSAPCAKRERQGDDHADPGDQRQRREQSVALGGDGLREHARFVDGFVVDLPMLAGSRVHWRRAYRRKRARCQRLEAHGLDASAVVPLVRLERTLR